MHAPVPRNEVLPLGALVAVARAEAADRCMASATYVFARCMWKKMQDCCPLADPFHDYDLEKHTHSALRSVHDYDLISPGSS